MYVKRVFILLMAVVVVLTPFGGVGNATSLWEMPGNFGYKYISGGVAIVDYHGEEKDVVIPDKIEGELVKRVEEGAFKDKGLTSVELPKG